MKLDAIELIRLLPEFMQEDAANIGLAHGVNQLIRELAPRLQLLSTWGHIEEMTEAELDALAWELNIRWYHLAEDIEIKRQLVRESDLTHARLGTPWAVESTIQAYFGDARVEEWFEYGGEPHHFRVVSENVDISRGKRAEFMQILEIVKRKSAWLDGILIRIPGKFMNTEKLLFENLIIHAQFRYRNVEDCIRFDGSRTFDGGFLMNQIDSRFPFHAFKVHAGFTMPHSAGVQNILFDTKISNKNIETISGGVGSRFSFANFGQAGMQDCRVHVDVRNTERLRGKIIKDNLFYWDGSTQFDGARKFNAGRTEEDI